MLIEPSGCPEHIEATVAIVGAGPAGIALALDLARRGVDVVLLSSGGLHDDAALDQLSKPAVLPADHVDPVDLKARRLGGLSWSWGGRCVPFDEIDFEPRPELGLPGWPISRDELMARAEDAAGFLGIGRPDFGTETASTVPATVERWCAQPKLMRRHMSALKAIEGPRVLLQATCVGGKINEAGRVDRLVVSLPEDRTIEVSAGAVVLAAGGLETARLLLWVFEANGRAAPCWTGRGYMGHLKGVIAEAALSGGAIADWNYQRTDTCFIRRRFALHSQDLRTGRLPNIAFHLDNPNLVDPRHGSGGLSALALALATPVVGQAIAAAPMRRYFLRNGMCRRAIARHLRNVIARPVSAVRFLASAGYGRLVEPIRPGVLDGGGENKFALSFCAEQCPRFDNGVRLGPERDRLGLPRLEIAKSLAGSEMNGVIEAHHRLSEHLAAAGIAQVRVQTVDDTLFEDLARESGDGYHQIGLTRMGTNSSDSVVDRNGRVHGLENLFIAGAATFPRSGQANPTFSIVCQALRLSEHLSGLTPAGHPCHRFTN